MLCRMWFAGQMDFEVSLSLFRAKLLCLVVLSQNKTSHIIIYYKNKMSSQRNAPALKLQYLINCRITLMLLFNSLWNTEFWLSKISLILHAGVWKMFLLAGHFKELSQYLTHHWLVLLLGLLSALFGFLCPQCWSSLIKKHLPSGGKDWMDVNQQIINLI